LERLMKAPLILCLAFVSGWASAQEAKLHGGFSAGIEMREQATSKDLGLPIYPGAQVQRDSKDDKGSVTLGLWGGAFGVHLAVGQYRSEDGLDDVAGFYRRALAPYGRVLECRAENSGAKASKPAPEQLGCDDAEPGHNGLVLKSGTKKDQRVVALQPKGKELRFQLVRLTARGD
jgi:hypothetical protein